MGRADRYSDRLPIYVLVRRLRCWTKRGILLIADNERAPVPGRALATDARSANAIRPDAMAENRCSRLAGQPIKLRFYIKNAKLYSFQFK